MMGVARIYSAHIAAAIRISFADRMNFWLQVGGMVVNNGFVLLLWFMFFSGFRSVGGWVLRDVGLMIGILATTVGLAGVLAGGYRDMAAAILRGDLDALLTQPRAILPGLLAAESIASAWGDVILGVVLVAWFAQLRWTSLLALMLVLTTSLAVYLATGVLFASLAFWVRGARSFSRDVVDFVILLSSYPGSIYSGGMKIIVYTLVPAGFVVFLPVALLRHPGIVDACVLCGAAIIYSWIGVFAFSRGLVRYRRQ